jgi:enoyl-CoA hydratase/long-chain 3-hydroxyacyl-CoA dehydrogenase
VLANITGLDNDGNWQEHFKQCDVVIEAVLEEMHIKHQVVQEFEKVLPEHAVIASNTSGLKVKDIASVSKRPENIVGMHYFSPVDKMQLLEVVRTDQTSDQAASVAVDAGLKQGKFVIVTKDVSGFYVNRCIGPMMVEVNAVLQEGMGLKELDDAMKQFGFPVGPVQLGDEVGIDVAAHLIPNLHGELGIRVEGASMAAYDDLVSNGFLGKKNNKGFYKYDKKGKRQGINPETEAMLKKYVTPGATKPKAEEAALRCGTRFALEAAWCMNDDVIRNPVDGDIGAVFGVGFPPFLGGPFRWMDSVGIQTFVDRLDAYKKEFGDQWEAPPILREMAATGKTWHE